MARNELAPPSINSLWDAAKQYVADAMPGGSLNREWTPERVESAKLGLGFTPVVGDVLSGYDAVQAARQGNWGEAALNAAGLLPFVPSMAGIFVGKGSRTWNKAMNEMAEKLEKEGASAEKIWEQTGNWRGPDGKWRQEINDAAAQFRADFNAAAPSKANNYTGRLEGPVGGLFSHENLYGAYPGILTNERMTAKKLPDWLPNTSNRGEYRKGAIEVANKTEQGAASTALHELQHAVQGLEGFARGGTPSQFPDLENLVRRSSAQQDAYMRAKAANGIDPATGVSLQTIESNIEVLINQIKNYVDPYEQYRRLAGEAEARAVQARRNLSDQERRATFPPLSYDVPINQLIVK